METNPEIASQLDLKKADMFSLGVIMYEMIETEWAPEWGLPWDRLRSGEVVFKNPTANIYLQEMAKSLLNPDPSLWPSAEELLRDGLPNLANNL